MIIVLLVEDHVDTRAVITKGLRQAGYQVVAVDCCASAEQAAQAADWKVGVVVCDVMLPDGDGAALAGRLKQKCGCGAVLMTGCGMASDLERYASLAIDRVLIKPLKFDEVEDAILACVRIG